MSTETKVMSGPAFTKAAIVAKLTADPGASITDLMAASGRSKSTVWFALQALGVKQGPCPHCGRMIWVLP